MKGVVLQLQYQYVPDTKVQKSPSLCGVASIHLNPGYGHLSPE